MRLSVSAACLLGAAALLLPPAAHAADLDEHYPPRAESPYDDPRYRDLYGEDRPPPPRYADPRYEDRRYSPSYKDEGYLEPLPRPPRFSEGPRYRDPSCLTRREVHQRLAASGWSGFHDIEIRSERMAIVKAYRPSGRLFDLEIDRCTGGIVDARQIDGPEQRPYAWREPRYHRGY